MAIRAGDAPGDRPQSSSGAARRRLPVLSEHLPALAAALERDQALGLILVDASPLVEIERVYGAKALRGALDLLVERVGPPVADVLKGGFHMLGDLLDEQRVYFFVERTRDDWSFYTRMLPRIATELRDYLAVCVPRIAYPFLSTIREVPVGHAVALWRPLHRPEGQIRRLIDAALSTARFEAERFRRERARLLENLIIEEGLSTVYEPIVELAGGARIGWEALARGPIGTALESPLACFGIADACGLEYELDSVCRRLALRHAPELAATDSLFLNILSTSVHDPDFAAAELRELLGERGLAPSSVVLEISERQAIGNYPIFREAMDHFSGLGFRIAVDDVGAGYSNLETALELSPDFLKIDMALVDGVEHDPFKQEILRGLVRLAERMQARVIAEGVETDEQLLSLRRLGISHGQGYLFRD